MGLLNPLLLGLGIAAAVPLLLHLLQRHQGPRVVFPALRYLRRAEKESARRIRVRQLLLMMLRVAAVLLIALAAARPFVQAGGEGHSPTAAVIILDNSLSTSLVVGDERVLDDLRARALEVLAAAGPEDRFWLLRAGEPDEPALAGDAEATAIRVRDVQPAATVGDMGAAVARANALLAAGAEGRAREIHLLTDLQAAAWGTPLRPEAGAAPVIVYHPGQPAPPNRGVSRVEVGGGMTPIAGQRTTVAATVEGDDDEAATVRLIMDDRLVAAATAGPGETAVLSVPAMAAGIAKGRVEIDADGLHADDTRFFAVRIAQPPAVAVTADQPFVADALEVLAEAGRLRRSALAAADVAFLPGSAGLEAVGARTAAIITPPTQPVQVAAANARLAAAGIPWRYGTPGAGEARFAAPAADPVLRALEGVRVMQAYPITSDAASASDSVLIRLADGTPWAVSGERRTGGRYILLGSPLTPDASTLPTGVAMLPLVERLTGAWALGDAPRTDVDPGTAVSIPANATSLRLPDGATVTVEPGATYPLGTRPGIYAALSGDSVVAGWAVNPPAAASDLERLDRRALEARLPGWTLHVATDAGAFGRATFRERTGREIWRPLLIALLVVLLIESLVAAAGRSRTTDAAMAEARTA